MKKSFYCIAVLILAFSATAQNYTPNISNGKLPADVTATDADGFEVPKTCYKNGITKDGWTVATVSNAGYNFVSPSHSHSEGAQDNRLAFPPLEIEAGAVLSWKARSVYFDFADTYKVIAKVDGDETETILFEGTAEEIFTPHSISLSGFAGKKTAITFVCTSENGYMLAVGDVFVGVPESPKLFLSEKTKRYPGNVNKIDIFGTVINTGSDVTVARITLTVDGEEVAADESGLELPNGRETDFSIALPVEFNVEVPYVLGFYDAEGNLLVSGNASVMASWFERNHFIDEGTAMWCNNCPEGTIALQKQVREYPGQTIIVCDHTDDTIDNMEYWPDLKFYAIPYMMLNRDHDTKFSSRSNFYKGLWATTSVQLMLKYKEGKVEVSMQSAEDIDNSADRYRIGYVVSADCYNPEASGDFYQKNNCTSSTREEYYFLPSVMASHLVKFHHVNVGGEGYFNGIEKSVPTNVEAYEVADCLTIEPTLPEGDHWYEPRANVYIIDTETGILMNAASILLDGTESEIGTPTVTGIMNNFADSDLKVSVIGHELIISGANAEIEIISLDGAVLDRFCCQGKCILPEMNGKAVIIRAVSSNEVAVTKVIL